MYLTQALKRAVQISRNQIATQDGERVRTWSESVERISKLAGEKFFLLRQLYKLEALDISNDDFIHVPVKY